MSKIYIYLLLISCTTSVFATELHHQQIASLYDHMVTVNQEWKVQSDLPEQLLRQPIQFNSDNERIQTHLKLVSFLLSKRTNTLSEEVLVRRTENLKSLVSYWKTGTFPVNTRHNSRQPYFIDDFGTACAVGHLLQTSGAETLAEQISQEENYAFIRELAYPQLGKWAQWNGFTEGELAWIQPGYPSENCFESIPGPGWTDNAPTSIINVIKTSPSSGNPLVIAGDFALNTNGNGSANSIAISTGYSYYSFSVPIQGVIHDVAFNGNELYAVGDFEILGTNYKNIVKLDVTDRTTWTGLQTSDMVGAIKHVEVVDCNVFIGGDFTMLNGQSQPYLAAYSITQNTWLSNPTDCNGSSSTSTFSANGPINDLDVYNSQLVVAGNFTQVGASTTPEGLAFFSSFAGWTPAISSGGQTTTIDHIVVYDGRLLLGSNRLYHYDLQTWKIADVYDFPEFQCVQDFNIGPFDALFVAESYSEEILMNQKGTTVQMMNSSYGLYDDFRLDVELGSGVIKAGSILGSNLYLGGSYSGTSLDAQSGCFITYYCSTPFNPLNTSKLMTFDVVLPLELSEFTATLDQETSKVDLNWKTQLEIGMDQFIIERSTEPNGNGFVPVGQVIAAGESTTAVGYQYVDDITRIPAPNLYYRLKMVEDSGVIEYSDVRVVKQTPSDPPQLSLYPNPSKGNFTVNITNMAQSNVSLSIYDVQGKLHHQETLVLNDSFVTRDFNFNHLSSGIYFVRVTDSVNSHVTKLELLK